MEEEGGFYLNRFQGAVQQELICAICERVVREPRECLSCGTLYCQTCIEQLVATTRTCTLKCTPMQSQFDRIKGALAKFYNNLDILCDNASCKKTIKIVDLLQHQKQCNKTRCSNFDLCGQYCEDEFKSMKVCGMVCLLTMEILNNTGNIKAQRQIIQEFLNKFITPIKLSSSLLLQRTNNEEALKFAWDSTKMGTGIALTSDRTSVFLKEQAYMFRSALSDTPMTNGIYYWEILADARTENELKIGVCTSNNINFNVAFCDTPHGFAYYGLGQLRANSNATGPQYGKRFKKEGILGVCLNMNEGTLAFALNGESMGVAFTSPSLKKGPIYAAVALLHCAGCTLITGKPKPSYMN